MSAFFDVLRSGRVLLMDGAMGTELQRVGLRPDECGESWNTTRAESVGAIHDSYVAAGAEVLLTNTFQSHPAHLARYGFQDALEEINGNAVRLARKAAGASHFVLGDIGPILQPNGVLEFAEDNVLVRVLTSLDGVDGILFETCSTPRALSAVRFAANHLDIDRDAEAEVPSLLSLSYLRSPAGQLVTLSGHAPEWFAERAKEYRVAALGVNCGRDIGMDDIIDIICRYRAATDLPLFARPNAGTPAKQEGQWIYPHSPEAMAARLPELLDAGATMIGGCCGTTPDHIAAFRAAVDSRRRR
jgi:5-methyltetrahydrofolate--homocysteine methyltransferase